MRQKRQLRQRLSKVLRRKTSILTRSSAVLTGSGTVLADNPALNARPDDIADLVQPLRVIVDTHLSTPPGATLFRHDSPVLIAHAAGETQPADALQKAGAELQQVGAAGRVDELVIYQAPSVLGADARGMFVINPLQNMTERYNLELRDVRRIGEDIRTIYRLKD